MPKIHYFKIPAMIGISLLLFGCATTRNTLFEEADKAAMEADFLRAATALEDNKNRIYSSTDGVLYYLDTGLLYHRGGEPQQAIERLERAELLIEEYFTQNMSQAATSILLNDTTMNYDGEDFEDIYLNLFKSLSYIELGDSDAAMVEIRRFTNKLNLLEDKYKQHIDEITSVDDVDKMEGGEEIKDANLDPSDIQINVETVDSRFHNSALARYLGMVLRRADGDLDGVRIDYEQLQSAFDTQASIFDFNNPIGPESVNNPDSARVSVLGFSGKSPIKQAQTLWVTTQTNMITIAYAAEHEHLGRVPQGFLSFPWPGVPGGQRFKFEIPRLLLRGSDVTDIRVYANNELLGELALLENMEQIALEAFRVKEPFIFLRSVTRTILKGIAGYYARQAITEAAERAGGGGLGFLAGLAGSLATDLALDASEQADLRISRYFPAYAHVGEWDIDEGLYDFRVEFYNGDQLLHTDTHEELWISEQGPNVISSMLYQ